MVISWEEDTMDKKYIKYAFISCQHAKLYSILSMKIFAYYLTI